MVKLLLALAYQPGIGSWYVVVNWWWYGVHALRLYRTVVKQICQLDMNARSSNCALSNNAMLEDQP